MKKKILVAALPIPGVSNSSEAVSLLARFIRSNDRSLERESLVQFPFVEGGIGTIDFLVTHSLGSFLEVEARGPKGEDRVVPIGFAGEEGKLAIIEMSRIAGVTLDGEPGTTVGVGELIQDALDEGAFSIILGAEEPLAFDAGLGAASALGVRFFDKKEKEIDFKVPGSKLAQIDRVDATQRSFALLSSRLFIARSSTSKTVGHGEELSRLGDIILRDTGMHAPRENLSASAIECGLCGLLGAEIQDGSSIMMEASGIGESLSKKEFSDAIILIPSWEMSLTEMKFMESICSSVERRTVIIAYRTDGEKRAPKGERHFYLEDAPLFQAPLSVSAGREERQRDFSMRLEKTVPIVLTSISGKSSTKSSTSSSHA